MHRISGEIHDHTFPYPTCRRRRIVSGSLEYAVERFALEIDRYEADNADRGRQPGDACALIFLCGRTVDLEHFHTGQLGHAPRSPVIACAKNDELLRTGCDRGTYGGVD